MHIEATILRLLNLDTMPHAGCTSYSVTWPAGNYSRAITSKRMDLVRDNYIE